MRKAGDVVRIYEDPLTEKRLEGEAKLIEKVSQDIDTEREYWLVEFTRGHERHARWIKKEQKDQEGEASEGRVPWRRSPDMIVKTISSRVQYFIDEEEKGYSEYDSFIAHLDHTISQLPEGEQALRNALERVKTKIYRIGREEQSHVLILKEITLELVEPL